jgi:hypothetical protein
MPYNKFIIITAMFHPVCGGSCLFETISGFEQFTKLIGGDFRSGASSYFRLLDIFCSLTIRSIHDTLVVFGSNRFVNARLLSRSRFIEETRSLAIDFVKSTSAQFAQTLRTVCDTFQGNQLLIAYGTTAAIIYSDYIANVDFMIIPWSY